MEVKGKNCVVLGAGKSGIAAAEFLVAGKAGKVVLSDIKQKAKLDEAALALEEKGVVLECGGHSNETILQADMIVISPGIPVEGEWYEMAKRHDKFLIGEIEFAYSFCKAKIIAVTGTNGKTTTTTLIYEILRAQLGERVALAGNIGIPFSEIVNSGGKYEYVVLEISSFQLETIKDFKPYIALLLNITEDHLDRYSSMQEYAEAKANIFRNQDENQYLILNSEDRFTNIMSPMSRSHKVYFSSENTLDDGYFMEDGWFVKNVFGEKKKIFGTGGMKISGKHNCENVMAALIVADILGLETEKVRETMYGFSGLEHRMEFVSEFNGIRFYNDSKATNVDAAIKAVDSFEEGLAVILGGREKGTDFTGLKGAMGENVRCVIALGENSERIKEIFSEVKEVIVAADMDDAVQKAANVQGVKTVLLSPACASFDLYRNYRHRGEEFKKSVLKAEKNA